MQSLLDASNFEKPSPCGSCFPTLIQFERDSGRRTVIETNQITEEKLLSHLRWVDQKKNGFTGERCESNWTMLNLANETNSASMNEHLVSSKRHGLRLEIVQYILRTINTEVQCSSSYIF